jgi:hypothetical protein
MLGLSVAASETRFSNCWTGFNKALLLSLFSFHETVGRGVQRINLVLLIPPLVEIPLFL